MTGKDLYEYMAKNEISESGKTIINMNNLNGDGRRFFSRVVNKKGQPISKGGRYLPNSPKLRQLRPGVFAGYLSGANKLWSELLNRGILTEESALSVS